jgi:hypothetical protein
MPPIDVIPVNVLAPVALSVPVTARPVVPKVIDAVAAPSALPAVPDGYDVIDVEPLSIANTDTGCVVVLVYVPSSFELVVS